LTFPPPSWLEEAMKKYRAKLDHVRLRPVFTALIPKITDKTSVAQAQTARIKEKVKTILEDAAILSDFHPAYYAYSYALDKSQRTLKFMVDRIREHQILRDKWEARELDPAILDKIDDVLIFALS